MAQGFDWLYSDVVKDHFMNPRNVFTEEEGFIADGEGLTGNIKCGDEMLMKIQVRDGRISECRWKTYGCASAIASTSMLSETVKGMTLDEAYGVTPEMIVDKLGGLPGNKIHCSVLGDKAIRAAIEDYYTRTGQPEKIVKPAARIVCQCMNVTDHDIEAAVKDGARTWEELQFKTKIGTVCGQCKHEGNELLEGYVHLYG